MLRREFIQYASKLGVCFSLPTFFSLPCLDKKVTFVTSIPLSFPVLGQELAVIYSNLSRVIPNLHPYNSDLNHWDQTHPNQFLSTQTQYTSDNLCILSRLGEDLYTNDHRLSLIENVPFVGRSGYELLSWLHNEGGLRYWQAAASDWGLHVLPAMVIDSTHVGWLDRNVSIQGQGYSNLSVYARGTVSHFFDRMGSLRSRDLAHEVDGAKAKNIFVQMSNESLDLKWNPGISNLEKIGSGSNSGAFLMGLYFPKKLWNSLLNSQKLELENICKASVSKTQKLTSFANSVSIESQNSKCIRKDFSDFVHDELLSGAGPVNIILNKKLV